ncbi:MAG: outer membrane beta-barrel protein [Pseudomonadota bacterium]
MKRAILAALLACAAAPALAQERENVYGTLGFTYLNDDEFGLGAITARAGYEFNPSFAVEGELSYGIFDDEIDGAGGADADIELGVTFGAFGVYRAPVSDAVTLFARGGLYRIEFDVEGNDGNNDDIAPAFGGGAEVNFDDRNALRFGLTFADVGDNSVELFEASFVRRF